MQNNDDVLNTAEKINDFVRKNRTGIYIFLGLLFAMVAGLITFFTLQDVFYKKAIVEIEDLNRRFTEIRFTIGEELYSDEDFSSTEKTSEEDIQTLLADLNAFANAKSGFPGSKAWAIIAEINSSRGDWQQSEEAWVNASVKGKKTYLGPLALFNAAAAAEEQGKYEKAIEYLQECVNHNFEFPSAPRAQFNIGRMYEKLEDYPTAIDAYREVLVKWQDIPVWQHFARSAIIAIEVK